MHARVRAIALIAALPMASGVAAQAPWQPWASPAAMARLDASMVSREVSSFCSDGCRYDRLGRGDEAAAGNPHPDRWLYRDGDEVVLYDDPGAGVVTRLWLASGGPVPTCFDDTLRVKLYFGDAATPALDLPLAQLFDGSTLPFTPPLVFDAGQGSGGYASYVPIAYASGLRIALEGLDLDGPCSLATPPSPPRLWYQIDAQRLPPGAVTADFSPADAFLPLRDFLVHAGDDPWARGLPAQGESFQLAAGGEHAIQRSGSGWLAGLRVQVDAAARDALLLEITADGAQTVSLPLSRAFGVDADDALPMRSPLAGLDASGWLYLWWPLPYRHELRITLRNASATTAYPVALQWFSDDDAPDDDAAALFARVHSQCGDGGVLHRHTLLALPGSGRVMALGGRFRSHAGADARYLEGDTRIRFDGNVAPTWPGSGLEDFYNGGFYFDWGRPYRQALSGAARVDTAGTSAMWRLLLADAPGYANGIELLQESGAAPDEPLDTCMDTVAWGYARAARALVPVARLEVGDATAVARHAYVPAAGATCASLQSAFADAGASARTATVCRSHGGDSRFHVSLPEASPVLRLRRVTDAAGAGQAAWIVVNGAVAGSFPPLRPDTQRRWQEQDAPLAVAPGQTQLDIRIEPMWGAHGDGGTFGESAYELWAVPGEAIFSDGFEPR